MKILWAIDPFAAKDVPLEAMARYFGQLGGAKTVVVPAYVASPAEAQLSLAFDVPERDRFGAYPKSLIAKALAAHQVSIPARRIRVVYEGGGSLKAAADRLVTLAAEERADVIAVFSHSNKGLKRVVLGSFAETLVHRSPVSVLVFNPACTVPAHIDSVLFGTDLGTRAGKTLDRLLGVLPPHGPRLVFFHALAPFRPPAELAAMGLVGGLSGYDDEGAVDAARRNLDRLAAYAVEKGYDAESRWEVSEARTAALVLKHAKIVKAGLVVVTAQAGPLKALFLGSVTREVLRTASLPVWVVRT
jgi:nucleotide-binding universal stress UspA family protein